MTEREKEREKEIKKQKVNWLLTVHRRFDDDDVRNSKGHGFVDENIHLAQNSVFVNKNIHKNMYLNTKPWQ